MNRAVLVISMLLGVGCGGGGGRGPGGGDTGDGTPFVMQSVLVGSCHGNIGDPDEDCTAWRYNTHEDFDVRAFIETACAAPDVYGAGQCGAATYGCCKWTDPNTDPGQWTAMYSCAIGPASAPSEAWNYPEACELGGGTWSAGPPSL